MSSAELDRSTRVWQTPSIQRVGTFGAVMRGGSRPNGDPGIQINRKINNKKT